jgi:aminoglycoside 6-adenylyltransferase
VIFDQGVKVDFTLCPLEILSSVQQADEMNEGYQVLLDKHGVTSNWPAVATRSSPAQPPSEKEFRGLVTEFWFESYHVAKYLYRDELWMVKSRDWAMKELLLRMMEWHSRAVYGWQLETYYLGKRMRDWAVPEIYDSISDIFAHFDRTDSWRAMNATNLLFRRIALDTAERLGYAYPQSVDDRVTRFVANLETKAVDDR